MLYLILWYMLDRKTCCVVTPHHVYFQLSNIFGFRGKLTRDL